MSPACWAAVMHGAQDFGQSWMTKWWVSGDDWSRSWVDADPGDQASAMGDGDYGSTWAYGE